MLSQKIKMIGLAKEKSFISSEQIHRHLQLVRIIITVQQFQVFGKVAQLMFTQAFCQTAHHQQFLEDDKLIPEML